MKEITDVERGWAFASQVLGVNIPTQATSEYVGRVEAAVSKMADDMTHLNTNKEIPTLGGDLAEYWHADTFNIDAAASNVKSRAEVLVQDRPIKYSTDIRVTSSDGTTTDYGLKYYKDAIATADQQSKLNTETREPAYKGQKRLSPSDQADDVRYYAHLRAESELRKDVAKAYRDTSENTVDRVSDGRVESKPLSKEEDLRIARELQEKRLNLEDHGVSVNDAIKPEYIMKQAAQAGLTAATVTMIMQTAPEIYKAISYLIKTGELDLNQIKKLGAKAISAGAEGFLRGSIACTLQILCEKGAFGAALKAVDATVLGTVVALTFETVKNSILVAAGKMTAKQMGGTLVDCVLISTGYVIGAKIGGIIGQALGFELPVVGYILGSLVGCAFAAIYNIGKKKLISFCVDTGFTCFGLVEQDYTLPEEALRDMGIDVTPITRTEVRRAEINRMLLSEPVGRTPIDTIDIKVLHRGIIGVNKVGYIY